MEAVADSTGEADIVEAAGTDAEVGTEVAVATGSTGSTAGTVGDRGGQVAEAGKHKDVGTDKAERTKVLVEVEVLKVLL